MFVFRPVQQARYTLSAAIQQIAPGDHHAKTGRAYILLRPGINHSEAADVYRARQNSTGHVGHERHASRIGHEMKLHATDGFVGRVMQVFGLRRQAPLAGRRDRLEAVIGSACCNVHIAKALCLLDCLSRPGAGIKVIDPCAGLGHVERHHGELQARAPLGEQDAVRVGNAQQLPQVGFGFFRHRNKFLASVADLHDGHAGLLPVQELFPDSRKDGLRQHCRTGAEIIRPRHCMPPSTVSPVVVRLFFFVVNGFDPCEAHQAFVLINPNQPDTLGIPSHHRNIVD